ncbi:MAG: tetratricopeptide repeat protein [Bacteroidia bacterium]
MMLNNKYVFVFISIIHVSLMTAQSKTDSLTKALNGRGDTAEIKTMNLLAWEFCKMGEHEKGINYSMEALNISKKTGFKKGEAGALNNLGNLFFGKANYPEALRYYLAALKISETRGDKKMIVSCNNNLGLVYEKQNDFEKSLQYHFTSLRVKEQLKDRKGMANSYTNIGNVYNLKGSYEEALKYYNQSMAIAEELGRKGLICSNLNNIGYIYLNTKRYDEAEITLQKALNLSEQLGDEGNVLMALVNLGSVNIKQGKELNGNAKKQKFENALALIRKALEIAKKSGAKFYIKDSFEELALLYNEMHDPKKALVNYKQFILYRDSVYNEENTKKSLLAEMNYEFEKKEAMAKADAEKKEAIATAEREKERQQNQIVFAAIITGLMLVSAFAVFVARANYQKRKANLLVEQQRRQVEIQKEMVEHKQKEILDSIYYARRIQRALLPTERYIDRQLKRT